VLLAKFAKTAIAQTTMFANVPQAHAATAAITETAQ
jgi:hypothetical protein